MRPPPFLISGALLFWAMYAELLVPAAVCGIILELPRWTGWRLEIKEAEVRKVWLLTCLILITVTLISFMDLGGLQMFSRSALYAPLIFFPLALVQAFHSRPVLEFQMLFLKPGRRISTIGGPPLAVNWLYLYLIVILISTGLQARGPLPLEGSALTLLEGSLFYLGVLVLLGLAFWKFRTAETSPIMWIALFILSGALGLIGSVGIKAAQEIIDREVVQFMMKRMQQNRDPFKTSTAIGQLEELKLYGHIVFRIRQLKGEHKQFLLAQNGYTVYRSPNWFSPRGGFDRVSPEPGGLNWRFGSNQNPSQILKIISPLEEGSGFLPLPATTSFLGPLPAGTLLKNRQGGLLVQGAPEWTQFFIEAGEQNFLQTPPTEADLSIPPHFIKLLGPTLNQLQLEQVAPPKISQHVEQFFEENFKYALKGTGPPKGRDPIDHFLNTSRAGHCEYFATAATLLLRAAGIPARYMVGYSVHEQDPATGEFVVRLRNAHSWTLAWIGGKWVEVDATPSAWIKIEDQQASSLEWIGDVWGSIKMFFIDWRWFQEDDQKFRNGLLVLLFGFILVLGWKVMRRTQFNRLQKFSNKIILGRQNSQRTPFSKIEDYLERNTSARRPDETYRNWFLRLAEERENEALQNDLEPMLARHYRLRFDPECDEALEEPRLQQDVEDWLREQEAINRNPS